MTSDLLPIAQRWLAAEPDDDIRAGLIAMIRVQDPVGLNPNEASGHGSGFDRVGAFQVGFQEGLARCERLIDEPLPLTPLQFLNEDDFLNEGNAPFGFEENELFGFLVPDLNLLYDNVLCRDYDTDGRNYWVSELEAGLTRHDMLILMSESTEYLRRTGTRWSATGSPA